MEGRQQSLPISPQTLLSRGKFSRHVSRLCVSLRDRSLNALQHRAASPLLPQPAAAPALSAASPVLRKEQINHRVGLLVLQGTAECWAKRNASRGLPAHSPWPVWPPETQSGVRRLAWLAEGRSNAPGSSPVTKPKHKLELKCTLSKLPFSFFFLFFLFPWPRSQAESCPHLPKRDICMTGSLPGLLFFSPVSLANAELLVRT